MISVERALVRKIMLKETSKGVTKLKQKWTCPKWNRLFKTEPACFVKESSKTRRHPKVTFTKYTKKEKGNSNVVIVTLSAKHNVTRLTDFNPDLKVEKKVFYVRSRAQTFFFLNDRKFRCRPDKKIIKPAK